MVVVFYVHFSDSFFFTNNLLIRAPFVSCRERADANVQSNGAVNNKYVSANCMGIYPEICGQENVLSRLMSRCAALLFSDYIV